MSTRSAATTDTTTAPSVSSRHTSCRIFTLLPLAATILFAANPALTLQVSNETAPPGGFAQFKVSLTSPALVSSASVTMNFDPTIFGNIASVAAFSATGDQTGYATLNGTQLEAYFSSSTASIGQLPDLPVFVVTIPILSTAKTGTTSTITVDPTKAPWLTGSTAYAVSVNPGTFTVGGALSIQNVTPGGGLLSSGTVVTIKGTGFDAATAVGIDGVSIASTQLVSAQEINVTLGGSTEMTGKQVHLSNPAGASVDYFASLTAIGTANGPSFVLALLLPSFPWEPQTTAEWDYPVGTPLLYYSCLQNPSASPVTATYYFLTSSNLAVMSHTVTIPPYGLYIANTSTLAMGLGPLIMTASAPLRMAEYLVNFETPAPLASVGVGRPRQITSLSFFGIGGGLTVPVLNWQLGTPAPHALTASVGSGFPFTVSTSADASEWLQVTPTGGGSGTTTLTFTPNVSNLGAGTYTATITLTENLPPDLAPFGSNTSTFTLTLNVSAQPTLVDASGTIAFTANIGGPAPAPSTITLTTNGTAAPFTASIMPVSGGNWLSVTPSSGTTPGPLTLTANPAGLASGSYSSNLIIQGPINTLTVPVGLFVPSTTVTVNPTSVSFTRAPGQVAAVPPTIVQIQLANPTLTFAVTTQTGGNWLTAALGPFGSVQLSAGAVNLGPGTYQGTLTVVATAPISGTVTVPVTLTVTGAPGPQQFTVSPSSLTLSGPAGALVTGNLNVNVASGPPYFTIPSATGVGFKVTPPASAIQYTSPATTQYTAPATVQISVTEALPGTYQDSITISWNGGSAVIPVTYYATATSSVPPTMSALVGSGSANPGSIAPGELITIFGSGLGGAPASLGPAVTTNLGGTQVLINGTPAPMIYTSTGQVNAIVPYEASGTASVQVVAGGIKSGAWDVPVVPSAPSIFTAFADGVGQGAIVNQDGSVNNETNPASRGTAIQIYATGGGQTSPPSSTGSVAQAAASLTLPVTVTIGGVQAQVLYAGNAPGEVEGVIQINALVPSSVTSGAALPVVVTIGGVPSQTGVTIAVR